MKELFLSYSETDKDRIDWGTTLPNNNLVFIHISYYP
jgi:hypothetical protein